MMLPTSSTLSAATPSRARCSLPSCDGVQSTSAIESVTIRLISSGIVRSPLRKPGLEMRDGDQQLRADERARERRVHVADDDDPIRPLIFADLVVLDHHTSRLLCVATAADSKVDRRLRKLQIREERVGHVRVVVLAGMHDARAAPRLLRQGVIERRDLHEIGARSSDEVDCERAIHDHGRTVVADAPPPSRGRRDDLFICRLD